LIWIVGILVTFIVLFVVLYRQSGGEKFYKYISTQATTLAGKVTPYSFGEVRKKVKELGQEYTPRQYITQVLIFAVGAAVVTYLYFYNLIICVIYAAIAVSFVPYLAYLRCKRVYSEFIFEQIQVYCTNTIMEFQTTQSFVKAVEGVYNSGVLEDPVKSDVKRMIDLAYENGTINESIAYMEARYDFYMVRNLHQIFYQITNEGSKDSAAALENMSMDIDMLVEGVYRDRIDRKNFHKKFLQFGIVLYLMVMLIQMLLGSSTYVEMLQNWMAFGLLHMIIIVNTYFLLSGEKYYNENVGAE